MRVMLPGGEDTPRDTALAGLGTETLLLAITSAVPCRSLAGPDNSPALADNPQTIAAARTLCSRCPETVWCRALGVSQYRETGFVAGVWGGLGAAQITALASGQAA